MTENLLKLAVKLGPIPGDPDPHPEDCFVIEIPGLDRFRFVPIKVGVRTSDQKFFILWNERWRSDRSDVSHLGLAAGPQDTLDEVTTEVSRYDNRTVVLEGGAETIYFPGSGFGPIWGQSIQRLSSITEGMIPPGAEVALYGKVGDTYILVYKIMTGNKPWEFIPTIALGDQPDNLVIQDLVEVWPHHLFTTFDGGSQLYFRLSDQRLLMINQNIAVIGEECDTFTVISKILDDPNQRHW